LALKNLFPDMTRPGLVLYDITYSPSAPQGIKLGDMNQDGYPDLLFMVSDVSGSPFGSADSTPHVLLSSQCKSGAKGCFEGCGTGYQILSANADALSQIKDAKVVSFYDLDEDVLFHCVIMHAVQMTDEGLRELLIFLYNVLGNKGWEHYLSYRTTSFMTPFS
jgi:hypothetical protein